MAVFLKTPLVIVTDDDLVRVSRENPGYPFEREEDGAIIVSPAHAKGGAKSLEAAAQLQTRTPALRSGRFNVCALRMHHG
jgi:hypothetical protein